jgi:hypothetical protein
MFLVAPNVGHHIQLLVGIYGNIMLPVVPNVECSRQLFDHIHDNLIPLAVLIFEH